MTGSDVIYEQLRKIHESISESFDSLRKLQSDMDREVAAIYHEIEGAKFDVVRGYRFAKRLQDVLLRRRDVKAELAKMQPMHGMFRDRFAETQSSYMRQSAKDVEIRAKLAGSK